MSEEYIQVGGELITLSDAAEMIIGLRGKLRAIPKGTSERDYLRMREMQKESERQIDIIMDLVNQGCSYKGGWNTSALSTYQEAVEYLVRRGRAKWINKGFTFEFVEV